jgi:hypothetical protein
MTKPGVSWTVEEHDIVILENKQPIMRISIQEALCDQSDDTIRSTLREFASCHWLKWSKFAKAALAGNERNKDA